ncbi:MAG: recombinase [Deltaproteobacteria bacterium HGW-Deltaproteobacteria-7]|nr:MAG: recombinase [Deltaproteobacteria bacterium HGW-Deltaproteobacteria-7]
MNYFKIYKPKKNPEGTLWSKFSLFIRLRDSDERGYCRCISCGLVRHYKEMDAGHFIPQGSSYALKYNEDNVHAQCTSCNKFKSGNLVDYRINLVNKIGEQKVKRLETLYQMKQTKKHLDEFEIKVLSKEYHQKINDLLNTKFINN